MQQHVPAIDCYRLSHASADEVRLRFSFKQSRREFPSSFSRERRNRSTRSVRSIARRHSWDNRWATRKAEGSHYKVNFVTSNRPVDVSFLFSSPRFDRGIPQGTISRRSPAKIPGSCSPTFAAKHDDSSKSSMYKHSALSRWSPDEDEIQGPRAKSARSIRDFLVSAENSQPRR